MVPYKVIHEKQGKKEEIKRNIKNIDAGEKYINKIISEMPDKIYYIRIVPIRDTVEQKISSYMYDFGKYDEFYILEKY